MKEYDDFPPGIQRQSPIPSFLTSIIQSRIRLPDPAIFIVGVYKPDIPGAVYREQWKVTGSDERTQEHFERLVLSGID